MSTYEIKVTYLNSEVISVHGNRGCLESTMASEATNMHTDSRVIEVADSKFEVKINLRGHLEAIKHQCLWTAGIG